MAKTINGEPDAETVANSEILTKQEAAELLNCTTRFIEKQASAGRLRVCKVTPKFVRIYRRDLDQFLSSGASITA